MAKTGKSLEVPALELAGTYWMKQPEFCPTLSKIAEADVLLPGTADRTEVEAEIVRLRLVRGN
jgi:hypothetical protein